MDPYMDPKWIPIWILYGRLILIPYGSLYGLFVSYMNPYIDPIWISLLILYGLLYGSHVSPYMSYMDPI